MDDSRLRLLLAQANPFREGDLPVGGTADPVVREDAQRTLLATTIGEVRRSVIVDDDLTSELARSRVQRLDGELDSLTMAQMKAALLGQGAVAWARRYEDALASEAIAAVVKVMTNDELSSVARALFNPLDGEGAAIGAAQHFGSRIQPNSPGDDEDEILFSILEGLTYGCGDVIIGLNPAADDLDTIIRLEQLLDRSCAVCGYPPAFASSRISSSSASHNGDTHVDVILQSLAERRERPPAWSGGRCRPLDLARVSTASDLETGQGAGGDDGVARQTWSARSENLRVARDLRQATARRGLANAANAGATQAGPDDRHEVPGPSDERFQDHEQLERVCLRISSWRSSRPDHGPRRVRDVPHGYHDGALKQVTERVVARAAPAFSWLSWQCRPDAQI